MLNATTSSRPCRRWVPFLPMLLAALGSAATAANPSLSDFFKPAPDLARNYAPDKVYPRGRIFPFTLYSMGGISDGRLPDNEVRAILKRAKGDGFTMIGPQYELNDRVIADAKAHGLKAVYTVGLPVNFHDKKPPELTPTDIVNGITRKVQEVAEHSEIAWWYLQPEELRHWRDNEMAYLELAAKTIRQVDPQKRPVWMYDPGHRIAEDLARTAKHLDICGKGIYTNYTGQRDTRIWVRWSIEQEIEAIKIANPSAIPIVVPEMFQQPADEHLPMILKRVRHDVYLALVSGAKGVVVFSMRRRPKFTAHDAYYKAYASVARELNGPLNLGQVFLFGQRRNDIGLEILAGPQQISPKAGTGGIKPPAKKYPPVSFLDLGHAGDRYLFAVNSANVPVRVRVTGLPGANISARPVFAGGSPFQIVRGAFELSFDPLAVKALRFRPATRKSAAR